MVYLLKQSLSRDQTFPFVLIQAVVLILPMEALRVHVTSQGGRDALLGLFTLEVVGVEAGLTGWSSFLEAFQADLLVCFGLYRIIIRIFRKLAGKSEN